MATCETYAPGEVFSEGNLSLLARAFKDEKFRELFCEYAKDLCDPEKQKQYEHELKQYEKERGVDVVFIEPRPFLALAAGDGDDRIFVNICSSDAIQRPTFEVVNNGAQKGQRWSFPHALPQSRREYLSNEELLGGEGPLTTTVHDVVFHPDAVLLASRNDLMRTTIIQTAMDSLKKNSKLDLDTAEELEGTNYVGKPIKSVIKKVVNQTLLDESEESENGWKKVNRTSSNKKSRGKNAKESEVKVTESESVSPVYKLKHVSKMDLQDFSVQLIPEWKNARATRPQALEVEVQLPGVERAAHVDIHVLKQVFYLSSNSTPKYKLELPLPYPVDDDSSSAKFDVATQKLTLTFPVIPVEKNDHISAHSPTCDSGIECENGYRTNSDGDNSSEVSVSSQDDSLREEEGYDSVLGTDSPPHKPILTPGYSIRQNDRQLLVSLNCGNVLESSIETKRLNEYTARVELSSMGGGQTLLHYGLSIDCSPYLVPESGITCRVNGDTPLVTIRKVQLGSWGSCQVGNGENLTHVELEPLPTPPAFRSCAKEDKKICGNGSHPPSNGAPPRSPRMCRTLSMCETSVAPRPGVTCSWPRGILKRRTRSLSESQLGAMSPPVSLGSSLDLDLPEDLVFEDDEEEEEGSMASSLGEKKSVRFNEVVSRQLFRSNRSIAFERMRVERRKQKMRKVRERRRSSDGSRKSSESDSDRNGQRKDSRGRGSSSGDDLSSAATMTTTTEDDTTTDTCDVDDLENNNSCNHAKGNKSKKKKRKDKNKNKKFEPSNNLIFQLDIEP